MGSAICDHCNAINSVTAIPNEVEGYFILEKDISIAIREIMNWGESKKALPGIVCRECGKVTLDKDIEE